MLLDLKILNGEMTFNFDMYVNNYTVNVKSDVSSLEIDYKTDEDCTVNILNNENFSYGINYVKIEVYKDKEKTLYNIDVYKEKEVSVISYNEINEVSDNKDTNNYYPYIIFSATLIVIIFFFILIFCRKKSKKVDI